MGGVLSAQQQLVQLTAALEKKVGRAFRKCGCVVGGWKPKRQTGPRFGHARTASKPHEHVILF